MKEKLYALSMLDDGFTSEEISVRLKVHISTLQSWKKDVQLQQLAKSTKGKQFGTINMNAKQTAKKTIYSTDNCESDDTLGSDFIGHNRMDCYGVYRAKGAGKDLTKNKRKITIPQKLNGVEAYERRRNCREPPLFDVFIKTVNNTVASITKTDEPKAYKWLCKWKKLGSEGRVTSSTVKKLFSI